MDGIMEIILKRNVLVKATLSKLFHDLQSARMAIDNKKENLHKKASEIARFLKDGILSKALERFSLPGSFSVDEDFDALRELKKEATSYCGCVHSSSYKGLFKEMEDLEKRSIRWSNTIQEARKIGPRKIRKGLRIAEKKSVIAARNARAFNYRLVHSRLPSLVTKTITSVSKVFRPMRQLWKKYGIEVITDVDFTRFNIKHPKD
ncbi:unnamed protein product [Owenia fusiformis]|uniref:Uncharacterized protein n=1 Tax=Owenia fusiformis TaxID=6347 RepID=A0A8S4PEP5_OWEFU|nr:unnamed protein product [Owenia fusiformis]